MPKSSSRDPLPAGRELPALGRRALLGAADHPVYETVIDGLFGAQDVVAVGVALYLLVRLAGDIGQYLAHTPLAAQDLARMYLHVRRLPTQTLYVRLVDEYA